MTQRFIIGTRGSKLAQRQAEQVAARIRRAFPHMETELRIVTTKGDRVRTVSLSKIGDRGLFTKELERALEAREIDCCVHSMKDVPTCLPAGMRIAAVLERADVRDALVSRAGATLATLPPESCIGTGSLRRRAQIAALRPDLEIVELRGNLDTRLARVADGTLDGAILACAGIDRMGWSDRISERLSASTMLPAAGQGAIGVEVLSSNERALEVCARITHEQTVLCVETERALMRKLDGGCQVPLGAWARLDAGKLTLDALVATLDGARIARTSRSGNPDDPTRIVHTALEALRTQGADDILRSVRLASSADAEPASPVL